MRPQLTPDLIAALSRAVPRRAQMVWVYLWARAGKETGKAWPSLTTIQEALQIRRHHVLEQIQVLEREEWLVVDRTGRGNKYTLQTPKPVDPNTGTDTSKDGPQHGNTPTRSMVPVAGTDGPRGGNTSVPVAGTPTEHTKNTPKNTTKKRTTFEPMKVELPFDSERFRQSWADYCQHRETIEAPLTDIATTRLLAKCKRWGEPKAIEAIDNTIESGKWTGLFEPKPNGKTHATPSGNGDGCPERIFT